jgi:hypothetical protein
MIFPRFSKRSRVYIDNAKEILGTAAVMIISKQLEYSGFEGPTLVDALEFAQVSSQPSPIQVFVKVGGITLIATLSDNLMPVYEKIYGSFARTDFFLTWNGKPLLVTSNPIDLGMYNGATIMCTFRQRGGMHAVRIRMHDDYFGKKLTPTAPCVPDTPVRPQYLQNLGAQTTMPWTKPFSQRASEFCMVAEYLGRPRYKVSFDDAPAYKKGDFAKHGGSSARLQKQVRRMKNAKLQSLDVDPKAFLEKYTDPEVLSFVEDVTLLCLQLLRAKSNLDRALAVTVFIKLRTGTSLISGVATIISDIASDLFTPQLQSAEDVLQHVTDLRSLVNQWEKLQESSVVQQITKVYKYAIALGVFALVGVKIDEKVAYICKKELAFPLIGMNFMVTVLDTVAMFIQRALMF